MAQRFTIAGKAIARGKEVQLEISIARLPSRTEISIPIIVNRAKKDGPVVLLMAGVHGDELNGIEVIRRIIDSDYNVPDNGTIICIPLLNIFGFNTNERNVTKGKDLNRVFPGSRGGSLASMLAHTVLNEVVSKIDVGVDFHTGGASRANYPQLRCRLQDAESMKIAKAFSAPFTIEAPQRRGTLRDAAAKLGKPILVYEGGESARFDEIAITEGVNGALRLLESLGMRKDSPPAEKNTIILKKTRWVRAHGSGLFHPLVEYGNAVKKGQLTGYITDPFGDYKVKVTAPADGYIICINYNPVVSRGDALMHVGME
ncbi:MAG: succinylglutamate desuccinylase/aspartoacylase family protein [Bacteroidota bacterium]|nr:succinylglutamate desuccinylase/aspartoacylase family protein [Bacteroidota bacterium]